MGLGEPRAPVQEREDFALVPLDKTDVRALVPGRSSELHPVLLAEALDLAVSQHGQPGQGGQDGRHAEVLVTLAELLERRLFVRVGHEVDVALEDLGVELDGLADDLAVAGPVLVAEHVHERAVVHAVHAQGADEVALEQPERLGQQERAGDLGRHSIHDLAPELDRHARVELGPGDGVLGARRDAAAASRFRPPQPLDVLPGEDHRGVEADDREAPGNVEDGPDDLLANGRVEEVELRRVVPWEARPVVAVVDIADVAAPAVEPLEHDCRVAVVPVVVLEHDPDPLVRRQVRATERVGGVGRLGQRQEPLGMLDDPARIDAHVVGDHVAGEPDAACRRPVAQLGIRRFAAEVAGDRVVVERVGRGDGILVAAHPLDPFGCPRPLPQADEPESRDAPASQRIELLVRDRVQGRDRTAVRPRQLVEPDVRALGHQDHARHPRRIR